MAVISTGSVKADHTWSIKNFNMKSKEELKSGVFSIGTKGSQTNLFMRMFPNGEGEDAKGFVSLFLYRDGVCDVPINADISFSIVVEEGWKYATQRCEYTFEKDLPCDRVGFAKFVPHIVLRNLFLLEIDFEEELTILCEISITNKPVGVGWTMESVSRLSLDFSSMFETGKFADCTVACEGREFRCHKNILAGRSTVFDAMFSHDTKENRTSRVVIKDLDGETVHDVLKYIYSGKVGELEDKASGLLSAAEKYDLWELKQMCDSSLCEDMNTGNVLDLLALADLYGAAKVKSLAHKVIVENGREIVAQAGWRDKLKVYPEIMADMLEEIEDLDGETVHDLVTYICTGKVGELEGKVTGLLAAAVKYDLAPLKQMCETSLCETMNPGNVLDLLALADLYGAAKVKSLAHKVIVDNGREIVAQAGWRDKLKVYPEILADMLKAVLGLPPIDKLKVNPEIMEDMLEAVLGLPPNKRQRMN